MSDFAPVMCDKGATVRGQGGGRAGRSGEVPRGGSGQGATGSGDGGPQGGGKAGRGNPPGTRSEVSVKTCLILPAWGSRAGPGRGVNHVESDAGMFRVRAARGTPADCHPLDVSLYPPRHGSGTYTPMGYNRIGGGGMLRASLLLSIKVLHG